MRNLPKVGLPLHPVAAPPAFVRAREVGRLVRDARESQGVTRIEHGALAIGEAEPALRQTPLVAALAAFCDEGRRAGLFERITA